MIPTVLLVDDDPNVLSGLTRALRREPYRVLTAEGPAAGFVILKSQPVDVVVADYKMPGMTGVDFAAWVRANHPSTMRMLLTGNASLDVAIEAINVGEVCRFMTKPCNPEYLAASIRHALREKEFEMLGRELSGDAIRPRPHEKAAEPNEPVSDRAAVIVDYSLADLDVFPRRSGGEGGEFPE